jgi:DNA-directed RNA polymerase specialized sigma24 family protein
MQNAPATFDSSPVSCRDLVGRIQKRNPAALEELYGMVKNFTYFLMRQLGPDDLQDSVHDVYVTVAEAITAGKLRDPERLRAFLTTVTRFYTYSQIERRVQGRNRFTGLDGMAVDVPDETNLETGLYNRQQVTFVRDILRQMPVLDCEILRRFYLLEQPKEQICREMQLTPTQFRNMKSQAKLALTEIGLRRLRKSAAMPIRKSFRPAFADLNTAIKAA